ncbi:hypothetical protein M8J77_001772 [Diaphorina citri]|nr:hypothetical protein M8J77_001772 [Diaphorina citri]
MNSTAATPAATAPSPPFLNNRARLASSVRNLADTSLEVIKENRTKTVLWIAVIVISVALLFLFTHHENLDFSGYLYVVFIVLLSGYAASLLYGADDSSGKTRNQ